MFRSIRITERELGSFCLLPGLGSLSPEMVLRHRPDASIMVAKEGAARGRASLWWSSVPEYGSERLGLIGHYAASDGQGGDEVLREASAILAKAGCTFAVGPMDGSTWRRYRLLTERGDEPVFFLEPDNPDDWHTHFDARGFSPVAHYFSAVNDDIGRCSFPEPVERRLLGAGVSLRTMDPHDLEHELGVFWSVARQSFVSNFLYTPIAESEFRDMYAPLLPAVNPDWVILAEQAGRPVGFSFCVPDLLQAKRGQVIDTAIIKTLAVIPQYQGKGLGSLLLHRSTLAAREGGIRRLILALMHERNPSRRLNRSLMRDFRRYTLFGRRL